MELRHLDTLLAIAEEGSFTAAADALATVQSNVSDQVRQLEAELGVPLLVRSRKGAEPTEFGVLVLDRARRVNRELEAMRADLALLQGLDAGYARLGVVGTASRWLVPALVADLRERAPGVRLRVNEGASERLFTELVDGELAQAVVTEPVNDRRLVVEHLLEEELIGLVGCDVELPDEPVPLSEFAKFPLVLPPDPNPLRIEVDRAAEAIGISLTVPVEVEGIRLIADLVVAGNYASDPARDRDPARAAACTDGHHRRAAPASAGDGERAGRQAVARRPGRARQRAQPRGEAHAFARAAREESTVTDEEGVGR